MKPETVLDLANIRQALVRMEDTIVFDLIERSQFSVPHQFMKRINIISPILMELFRMGFVTIGSCSFSNQTL